MKGDIAKPLPPELSDLLEPLEAVKRAKVEALFKSALEAAQEIKVINLWEQPELTKHGSMNGRFYPAIGLLKRLRKAYPKRHQS